MQSLNHEQSAAVLSDAPFKLVVAGPGSGKSFTLVQAILRAVNILGVKAEHIIVITFTNAAAGELQERLAAAGVSPGFVGTLHAFCLRLLRQHHALAGLPADLSVIDDDQREAVVEAVMAEMGVKVPIKKVMLMLEEKDVWLGGKALSKEALVAKEYFHRLLSAGLLDFNTILWYGLKVVCALRDSGKWPYSSAYIDEAQDSADIDWEIYDAMPCAHKFIVGDADQSVYQFRGASNEFNLRGLGVSNVVSPWTVFKLQANHRSGRTICEAAQRLIERNAGMVPKETLAVRDGGDVEVMVFDNPAAELSCVLEQVNYHGAPVCQCGDSVKAYAHANEHSYSPMEGTDRWDCIAILARTNRLADSFAQHLAAHGVPVAAVQRDEAPSDWRRAKLLLTVLANPFSDYAVWQYLRARDPQKADEAKQAAAVEMKSLNELLKFEFGHGEKAADMELDLLRHGLSAESRQRIHDACRELSRRGEWSLAELVLYLGRPETKVEGEGVFVGTIHASKGREWSVVFVAGMEEGLLPSGRKDTDVCEERRLAYVAMTRAKDQLVLTRCEARPAPFGPLVMRPAEPSRFIAEAGLDNAPR